MTTKKKLTKVSKRTGKKALAQPSSTKRRLGRAAFDKGRKFENQVAELYRLLGAKVEQNIEIHQKKVDILATFRIPGSSREYRVIVECKDEGRSVAANQRVMAFKGLLDFARATNVADSAEIVTRTAWGDAAKGFAKSSGIELFTYTEKISQLIDLTSYLKGLIEKFDTLDPGRPNDPPLGAYYVDLSAQRGSGDKVVQLPIIDTYIHEWLQDENLDQQLAVFGEYGSGKSTLCQKLARDLALAYLNDPNTSRIPILLNLRDFIGKLDLEAYITSFLDRECNVVNPRIELFRAMNEAGIFLMIFDGFDEMAVKVDADTLESNLLEIEKLAAAKNSKTMLTSRPEYFVSAREEAEVITPTINPFLSRAAKYEPLKISPWDEKQVELFLKKRVPLVKGANQPSTYYRDQIRGIGSLSDLSRRPVLLDMIVKTLPRLIASGETINLLNLYKSYLIGEMKRQKVLKKRSFLLTDEDRFGLLQELAVHIYGSSTQFITFIDAQNLVEKYVSPPKQELEAHTRDFLANSFLIRKDDEYRLSHKSILEYLVAMRLNKEIESDEPKIFSQYLLQREILDFLRELQLDTAKLIRWIQTSKGDDLPSIYLSTNAATLLLRHSSDSLAGCDLSGRRLWVVDFSNANLRGCNLKGALLGNCDLSGAQFYKRDIKSARFRDTRFLFYILKTAETLENTEGVARFIGEKVSEVVESCTYNLKSRLRADLFWEFGTWVQSFSEVERIRKGLSAVFNTKVCIGIDELERLAGQADKGTTK